MGLKISAFDAPNALNDLQDTRQGQYLRCYLADLGAQTVIEEPHYFDRDYLAEHSAFYSRAAKGISNQAKRLHFFARTFSAARLDRALGGDPRALKELQSSYLGFAVLRPLEHARFGRTVVRWYPDEPDRYPGRPRVMEPSREYVAHLAGVPLRVKGLAWQQQEGAVGVCATVGLWSLLHSSAFDDHHAIPTTAQVTHYAYATSRLGGSMFPASDGLEVREMVEAIARAGLSPHVLEGDLEAGFRREKFSTGVAVMVRSGFPVLISGRLRERGGHVVCATGFREAIAQGGGHVFLQDAEVEYVYVHDDNLGPNVRMRISSEEEQGTDDELVVLRPEPPDRRYPGEPFPDPSADYPEFIPEHLIVGVHEELRTTADELHRIAMMLATQIKAAIQQPKYPVTVTARFVRLARYLGGVLGETLGAAQQRLARVRRELSSELSPMSLFVGVVRIGYGPGLVADVLIDTSDRPRLEQHPASYLRSPRWNAFGTVLFRPEFQGALTQARENGVSFGPVVNAAPGED